MPMLEKLQLLGAAASWDSCGGVKQKSLRKAGIPASYANFVHDCSATSENCRLMKVLQSNKCIHDCKYCVNSGCSRGKAELAPEEIAKSFNSLEKAGYVNGLFLSSAVSGDADSAAEKMIESARILRQRFGFKGYIHLKVLPTMSKHLVFEMAQLADRLSLNLETPNASNLRLLGSTKDFAVDLQRRLGWIDEAKRKGARISFTTQFIVGAAGETDLDLLQKMRELYDETALHRAYFSAFSPVHGTPLEGQQAEKPLRERQLYQSDWLMRVYGFELKEIKLGLNEKNLFGNAGDVKFAIAANSPEEFPVDVNSAPKEDLLKVPGIGPNAAEKIISLRESGNAKFRDLKELRKIGVIARRAAPFIEIECQRQARLGAFC